MKTYLLITDLPKSTAAAVRALRRPFMFAFNTLRTSPAKMAELKTILKFMYNTVSSFEKTNLERLEEVARTGILSEAQSLGFDLDERLTTEKLEVELSTLIEQKDVDLAAQLAESEEFNKQELEKSNKKDAK